jgi:hypothetical protein
MVVIASTGIGNLASASNADNCLKLVIDDWL